MGNYSISAISPATEAPGGSGNWIVGDTQGARGIREPGRGRGGGWCPRGAQMAEERKRAFIHPTKGEKEGGKEPGER